jgi:hypothetical protein
MKIDSEFESMEKNIRYRVNQVVNEIKSIESKLVNSLSKTKEKFKRQNDHHFQKVTQIKELIQTHGKQSSKCEITPSQPKDNLHKFQDLLKALEDCSINFGEKVSIECKFIPDPWVPVFENIGIIETKLNDSSNLAKTRINSKFAFKKHICTLTSNDQNTEKIEKMFNLNDNYLVFILSDNIPKFSYEIVVIDQQFQIIKRVSSIGTRKFKQPVSICSDNDQHFYICDYGLNQIFLVDNEFSTIKKVIGKKGLLI